LATSLDEKDAGVGKTLVTANLKPWAS